MPNQFKILASESVTVPGVEIGERHPESSTNPGIHVVNLARESIWRHPLCHCVGIQ